MLPAVDIDTDISEISEIMDEEPISPVRSRTPESKSKKHVQIVSPRGTPNKTPGRSPNKAHYEVVYHEVGILYRCNNHLNLCISTEGKRSLLSWILISLKLF